MKDGVIKLSSNSFSDLLLTKRSFTSFTFRYIYIYSHLQIQPRQHGLLSLSELNVETEEALGTRLRENNIL